MKRVLPGRQSATRSRANERRMISLPYDPERLGGVTPDRFHGSAISRKEAIFKVILRKLWSPFMSCMWPEFLEVGARYWGEFWDKRRTWFTWEKL